MSDIRDFVIENGVLKKYTGNETEVVIPEGVTSIGNSAFRNCSALVTITLPDGLVSIGNSVFYSCKNLTTITIPEGVTSIGKEVFMECSNLTTIIIPDSLVSMGDWVFWGCSSLTAIMLPRNLTTIGYNIFNNCKGLQYINIDENNKEFSSIDGVLFNKNKDTILICPNGKSGGYKIPKGVTSIGHGAFSGCTNLTSIEIPESVTSIGGSAFSGCTNLTSVVIPESVTSIGWFAFSDCTNLTSVVIPESVTSIEDAFCRCSNLKTLEFPQNIAGFKGTLLETIWDNLSKSELKEVVLNSFITQLPIDVLNDADLSKKIKANKKLIIDCIMKNDEAEALEKFFSLYKTIKLDELNEYIEKAKDSVNVSAFLLDYKNKNYTVEKQEKIESDKLDKELGLKELTLAEWKKIYTFDVNGNEATITGYKGTEINVIVPSRIEKYKVVEIADFAFSLNASGLRKDIKELREKIESVVISEGVTSIGYGAFSGCTNLTSIEIPEGVKSIGDGAFRDCANFTNVEIPKSVTSIGEYSFAGCKLLQAINVNENNKKFSSINGVLFNKNKDTILICPEGKSGEYAIPDNVTGIAESAFKNCQSLTEIKIPESVISIGKLAFKGCYSLTAIAIPEGVTSIGWYVFSGCTNLTSVVIPESVTSIGEKAFYGCTNLTNIKIPGSVEKIGDCAFENCSSLTTITISEGVKNMGGHVFSECIKLNSVTIPGSVEEISCGAFANCENLTSIEIAEGVKSINNYAFENCLSLTTITIPEGVKSIGKEVFNGCTRLNSVTIPGSVKEISFFAFGNKKITIYAPAGSFAEQYAKENKIKVLNEQKLEDENAPQFNYKISKQKTVKLTSFISEKSEVVIPAEIDGYPVTEFSKELFKNNKFITSVKWPAEIHCLPKELFFGCSFLEEITLPEGVTEISEKAFRNCTSLKSIHIPASVTYINATAFECARNTFLGWEYWNCVETIHAPKGSYAEQYAKENKINFVAE